MPSIYVPTMMVLGPFGEPPMSLRRTGGQPVHLELPPELDMEIRRLGSWGSSGQNDYYRGLNSYQYYCGGGSLL